ncbi:MAG: ribulose-phosphate 3-epimerase [Lachnospiraceae bacterium]|uniref:Ribulose-phosphate 3-epimerase n=1 Tax=Candidatus Weimeria bifida TaxID=2599074 RepID=A0A6N7IXZ0_9FIRM|nr:ribulose-phosphate 3-epimerase [Candidatus Weimeria bifida]RRF96663.1 MAG: ribulose-phosphate 3-epimerase [Lachnospiraceae bacterium]
MNCLSPSLLSSDLTRLSDQVRLLDNAGAAYFHVDIMDGSFVPNISFGFPMVKAVRSLTEKVVDVHMMVDDPIRYVDLCAESGADIISVHYEACKHLDAVIQRIKQDGAMASVAINPATPVSALSCVLDQLDMVLVMTVNPGLGGQKLIPYTVDKIRELKKLSDESKNSFDIEVDGGVNTENAGMLLDAGANILVTGHALFSGDLEENATQFLNILEE